MRTSALISGLVLLLLVGCHDIGRPSSCETDAPVWLQAKIDSIASLPGAFGTRAYRYEWRGEIVYHIVDPTSSCAYCELYDRNGTKLQFASDDEFQDFLANKENEVLICEP